MSLGELFSLPGPWLLKSSAQAAVLVLVVLAVQWLFRRLPARWRHALWWLVVIRLVLPVTPSSGLSLFHWAGWRAAPSEPRLAMPSVGSPAMLRAPAPDLPPGVPTPTLARPPSQPVVRSPERTAPVNVASASLPETPSGSDTSLMRAAPMSAPGRTALLGWLWLAGIGVLAIRLGFVVVRMRRVLAGATRVEEDAVIRVLEQSCRLMGVRQPPPLFTTTAVSSPALCGLWRPRLLLPPGFVARFTPHELRLVFLHELAHLQRRDIAVNWLLTLLQLVHWFNPLVWIAFHRMRTDSELACDAKALSVAEDGAQRAYGQTIIKLLEGAAPPSVMPGVVGILEDRNQMKHRIRMIARFRPTRGRAGLAGVAAVVLGWVCLTDAPAPKPEDGKAGPASAQPAASSSTSKEGNSREVRVGADPALSAEDAPYGTRSLTIQVVDAATGSAVPHAEVLSPYVGTAHDKPPRRLTDDRGMYRLTFALPPVEGRREMSNFSVSASHPDFAPRSVMWTSSGGDVYAEMAEEITIRLVPGVAIGGRVQDEHGTPLSGVRVLLSGSGYRGFTLGKNERLTHDYPEIWQQDKASPAAITDASGAWVFRHLPADLERLEVTLVRPDDSQATFSTAPGEMNVNNFPRVPLAELRATKAVLTLPDGLTVRGIVVDEEGRALSGVSVKEGYGHGSIVRVSEFTTSNDGRFERPHRMPRQWIYTASRADRATVSAVAQVEAGMDEVRIVLPSAKPLRIQVVDEAGQPLPGVQLTIDPYRTEAQILDWKATTDEEGTATWTNPPTAPVTFMALSKDPPATRKFRTVPGDTEKRVMLKSGGSERVTVHVQAVDAESREPVKVAKVSADFEGGGSPFRTLADPAASEFTVTLNRADVRVGMYPSYRLKLEAEGYDTLTTKFSDFDEGDQELRLVLQRSSGPAEWVVRQPDGQPAAGARVWARATTDGSALFINAPRRYYGDRLAKADANEQGRLKLPAAPADAPVVVTHAKGFLASTMAELRRQPEVRLQAYGAVEGRVLVAGQPKSGVNVSLNTLAWSPSIAFHLGYSATTGPDGRFTFTEVPPGEYKLYRWHMPSRQMSGGFAITETYQWPLTVRAGQTNQVEYAFRGRPVIGQVVADPADAAVDWQNDVHVLALKLPPTSARQPVNREDYATFEAFLKANDASFRSDARIAEARSAKTYQLMFETDGSFRIEDVPPGTYELRIHVTKLVEGTRASPFPRAEDEIGALTLEVVVKEGPDPLDLGTLTVGIKAEALGRKSVPMDFTAETLEGKPLRLSEVTGVRLVVFWAAWSERSREALEDLKRLQQSLGAQAGLTIVGVSLDDEADAAARVVRDAGCDWRQARLGVEARAKLIATFDVTQLPTIFLVDSSGHVVNRDLEGERLRVAVKRLLTKP